MVRALKRAPRAVGDVPCKDPFENCGFPLGFPFKPQKRGAPPKRETQVHLIMGVRILTCLDIYVLK